MLFVRSSRNCCLNQTGDSAKLLLLVSLFVCLSASGKARSRIVGMRDTATESRKDTITPGSFVVRVYDASE